MRLNKKSKPVKSSSKTVFEMTCQSNPKEIGCIEKFLKQVNKKLRLDDGTMYRLLVSCTEAVNNAIIHGNKSAPDKSVAVKCTSDKNTLTISVKDRGEGFDPSKLQDPREEKNLMKESGRGFFLMQSLMDSVKVKKLKSGSVVEMKVRLH
ncbi:MAG: ATP-binding protein [Bacteroidetes bacterium]|nr:ATP-binding protein [Bacteroidota bacterium]